MVGALGVAGRAAGIRAYGGYGPRGHCHSVCYWALGSPLLNVPVLSLSCLFFLIFS